MSLLEESACFSTLDISTEVSVLVFDPQNKLPGARLASLDAPFSTALDGSGTFYRAAASPPASKARRDDILTDFATPTKRKLFEEDPAGRSSGRSPLSQSPHTAKKLATSPTRSARPPLLSLRSPAQPTLLSSPSRGIPASPSRVGLSSPSKAKGRTPAKSAQIDIFTDADTTTLTKFNVNGSLIADESGDFLAEATMTDDFSKLFIAKGKAKEVVNADETLAPDWFKNHQADAKGLMDESMTMLANMTITMEHDIVPPRARTLSAPAPLAPSTPQRQSPLKHVEMKSPMGRALAQGRELPPARPVFGHSAAPAGRQMGGQVTPRAAKPAAVPARRMMKSPSMSNLRPSGIAAPLAQQKTMSSTSAAVRTSAMPRPSSVLGSRPSSVYGSRPGASRLSGIPTSSTTATGLKAFQLPSAREPTSVPMVREISQPYPRTRPLSMQGGAALKRSLNVPASQPMAPPPRMPKSRSEMSSLASLARPGSSASGSRPTYAARPPVRRA